MSVPPSPIAALRHATRLVWMVLLAVALQPLATAQSPAVRWVALPYCANAAHAPGAANAAVRNGHRTPERPRSVFVLLNPAAAIGGAGTQAALPARTAPAVPSAAPAARACPIASTAPPRATPPPSPRLTRAPPRFS